MTKNFFLSKEKALQRKKPNQRVVKRKLKNGRIMFILRKKRFRKKQLKIK